MAKKKAQEDPIDFAADMAEPDPDQDLQNAMKTLRSRRRTRRPCAPPSLPPGPPAHLDIYSNKDSINNESLIEYDNNENLIDLEAKLTLPELKFLEMYLVHRLSIPKAFKR